MTDSRTRRGNNASGGTSGERGNTRAMVFIKERLGLDLCTRTILHDGSLHVVCLCGRKEILELRWKSRLFGQICCRGILLYHKCHTVKLKSVYRLIKSQLTHSSCELHFHMSSSLQNQPWKQTVDRRIFMVPACLYRLHVNGVKGKSGPQIYWSLWKSLHHVFTQTCLTSVDYNAANVWATLTVSSCSCCLC